MSHAIRVGTSGWSYDDWVGPFYPQGAGKRDYLAHYASRFDVVEVDSTYYAVPRLSTVQGWADRTPEHFRFALKMPGEITHKRVLVDCEGVMEQFVAVLEPLREKLICVLLQFGYFNRKAFATAGPFFDRLRSFLERYAGQLPLACEIRNKHWLSGDYFDLLRAHNVSSALVEHAWLPPLDRVMETHDVVTGPLAYVRLIGDRRGIEEITTTWEKPVVDRDRDLERVSFALRRIAERVEVVTFVNNHYAGHGPDTVGQLERCLAS